MRIANKARGEITARIDGVDYVLCLNMGALAKIEAAIGATSLMDMSQKLAAVSTGSLLAVVSVLLEAGGNPVDRATMDAWPTRVIMDIQEAITAVFGAAGMTGEGEADARPLAGPHLGENGSALPAATRTEAA